MRPTVECLILTLLCGILFIGCSTQHYEITMTPKGDRVERTLTLSRTSGSETNFLPVAIDEVNQIAAAYHHEVPPEMNRHFRFQARFWKQLPNDVGGHGTYVNWTSPCGSVTGYIERFRGSDDLIGELDARREAVAQLIDLFDRWGKTEWGTAVWFQRFRESLHSTVRRDFENLSCLMFISQMSDRKPDDIHDDIAARIVQYLLERKYLEPEEVPLWFRALRESPSSHDEKLSLALMQSFVIRLFHLPDDPQTRASLPLDFEDKALTQRLEQFLAKTPEYRELQRITGEDNLEPFDVIERLLYRAILPMGVLKPSDHVVLRLDTAQQPLKTNGTWNAERKTVEWDFSVEANSDEMEGIDEGHQIPRICYATWAVPNTEYQQAHFGDVLLTGEDLSMYCLWYRGLTIDEAREWDQVIDGLRPDDELRSKLRSFRFAGEPAKPSEDDDPRSLADPAVELLLKHRKPSASEADQAM